MYSLQYLSLFFLLGNEVSNVVAFPAATEHLKRDGTPLVGLGELASELGPLTDLPHIPLGERDESRIGMVKERAAKAFGNAVDLDARVPLDAYSFKERSPISPEAAGGHPVSSELYELLVRKGYLGGSPDQAGVGKRGIFNAEAQLINVTGEHRFIAPDFANGDKRGPCPGMNTLANHGFVSRNGIATLAETIVGANNVFGMGIDISTFLATYATVLSGNPLSLNPSYSIGDTSDEVENLLGDLGGLLGKPQGLDGTHNTFEVDGSYTRGDLYDAVGNNNALNLSYFQALYDLQKDAEEPNYTIDVLIEHNINRFDQVIATNPYFYYGPFSGLVLRNGAGFFAARLMVNCSAEHPEGVLNKETLKSFHAVSGPDDNLTYTFGHERIPDIWYRRPDDYTVPGVALDLVNLGTKYPRALGVGGNVNGVNSYIGIDLNNVTGSIENLGGLLQGNNLLCFALQTLKLASPNSLSSIYKTLATPLNLLFNVLDTSFASLACPAFGSLTYGGTDLFSYINATYPGAARSGAFF